MELISKEEQSTKTLTWYITLDDGRKVTVKEYLRENGRVDDTEMWADDMSDLTEEDEKAIEAFIAKEMEGK